MSKSCILIDINTDIKLSFTYRQVKSEDDLESEQVQLIMHTTDYIFHCRRAEVWYTI